LKPATLQVSRRSREDCGVLELMGNTASKSSAQ
jgi:hypothetical protein